jgi:uncharacterized protein YqeY
MNLKDQIQNDFLEAYKAKEDTKVSILRMLKSAIKNAEILAKGDLDEQNTIKVLKKEVKQRLDSSAEYERAGRTELAQKEKNEADFIRSYLPKELSLEETQALVDESITELDAKDLKDMGKVISLVMQKAKGLADGAQVSALVRSKLSK